MTPSEVEISPGHSIITIDGTEYPIQEISPLYVIAKGRDAGLMMLCRSCANLTRDPQSVKNYWCEKCKRFLNPAFPLGRVSMFLTPGELQELAKDPLATNAQFVAAAFDAMEHSRRANARIAQKDDNADDVMPPAGFRGSMGAPQMHWADDQLPLLAAIAARFQIDCFPPGTELFLAIGAYQTIFTARGSIPPGGRVIIRRCDGAAAMDTADWSPGAAAWSIQFQVTQAQADELIQDAIRREDFIPTAPTVDELIEIELARDAEPCARYFMDNAHTGSFARDVQRQLRGPIHG